MKKLSLLSVAITSLAAYPVSAASYSDATGDFTGGVGALDITSVNVNNNATTLTFTINLAGNPTEQTWYNYFVGIASPSLPAAGGNLNGTGGWGKDIQMSTGGMDYFVGAYPGFAGYSLLTWGGTSWSSTTGTASQDSSSVTIPVSLSSLGLSVGDTFTFDVWASTSGGDTVLDSLSDSTSRTWNSSAFDTAANGLNYTVVVPEPSVALIALGGLAMLGLSRRVLRS